MWPSHARDLTRLDPADAEQRRHAFRLEILGQKARTHSPADDLTRNSLQPLPLLLGPEETPHDLLH